MSRVATIGMAPLGRERHVHRAVGGDGRHGGEEVLEEEAGAQRRQFGHARGEQALDLAEPRDRVQVVALRARAGEEHHPPDAVRGRRLRPRPADAELEGAPVGGRHAGAA
jgi:hypothetical protein